MTIQEVVIENFLCYYDIKRFPFSEGLNIILGENGEGKTKFFEAMDWLFKGDVANLHLLVSAKRLAEKEIGESFRVRVSMSVIQNGELKTLTRQFGVVKTKDGCDCSRPILEGVGETASGERSQVDGERLLEQVFPSTIRRYSLFKGESALDIFDSPDALITLINNFSDAKYFDKYAEKGAYLKAEAEKAVEASTKSATKNKALYDKLESNIKHLQREKERVKTLLDATLEEIGKTEIALEEATRYVSNADELDKVNKRIADYESKISSANNRINEDFTTLLFDDRWILMHFEDVHNKFAEKINALSIERRKLQSQHDTEVGIKIGERQARAKLLNDAIPLPTTVPSKAQMEEMLKDELCKVCNRPAEKGSAAYEFMLARLQDYIDSQLPVQKQDEDDGPLFQNDYTAKLVNLAATHEDSLSTIRAIQPDIKEVFEFNETRKREVEKYTKAKEEAEKDRERVIGNSSIGEARLIDVLKNYNQWQRNIIRLRAEQEKHQKELTSIEEDLRSRKLDKDKIDVESGNNFLVKTRAIFRDICTIFKDTREAKFDEFVATLQLKSNEFFDSINEGAFTGKIVFTRKIVGGKPSVTIELRENERVLHKPNQSLLTSMHISILFAISELARERHEEGFPMLFDAPTSSFGETKTGAFLNIISGSGNQIILLLKDFIAQDGNDLRIKDEFKSIKAKKAFWVKLERPFDRNNLQTINTQVINL